MHHWIYIFMDLVADLNFTRFTSLYLHRSGRFKVSVFDHISYHLINHLFYTVLISIRMCMYVCIFFILTILTRTWCLEWNSRPVVQLRSRPNHYIQAVIDAEVVPRVVQLLRHESAGVHTPALRTVGNLVTGDDLQTDMVLNNDPFGAVMQLGEGNLLGMGMCGSKLVVVTCCDML